MMSKLINFALLAMALIASVHGTPADEDGIIGGSQVPAGRNQFVVSLQTTAGRHFCGGSLISPNRVLTAAHCVSSGSTNFQVRSGSNRYASGGSVHRVSRVIVHPSYSASTIRNDLAVVFLSTSSSFPTIRIDTSSSTWQSGSAVVAGWGATVGGGGAPAVMRQVTLPVVADSTCRAASFVFANTLTTNMMCTGYSNGVRGSCNGDSGGPLFSGSTQIGLVSWGISGCVSYSVFTQVNRYASWISNNAGLRDDEDAGKSCACVGADSDLDTAQTCGNWLNAGFDWCYTDQACDGAIKSERYDGKYLFQCAQSRHDLAQQYEQMELGNTVPASVPGSEKFYLFGTNGSADVTAPAEEAPAADGSNNMLIGLAAGAAGVGLVAVVGAVFYKRQKDAVIEDVIKRAESERQIAAPEM